MTQEFVKPNAGTTTRPPRLVVGIGASAGGLEAFKSLLDALPDEPGMTFLLVQHLDPTHPSVLTELLEPRTKMRVTQADAEAAIETNTIYVIRPDTALAVANGRLVLTTPARPRGVPLPVDHLFRSLAREYGARAVGIVLSGAGSDGSDGIRHIKSGGGLTIAQQPAEAKQTGMPQSAIDTGVVDLTLDIAEIPDALVRFAGLPTVGSPDADRPSGATKALSPEQLRQISTVLELRTGFELKHYKPATIERRVLRRCVLAGHDDVERYIEQLGEDGREQQTLIRDLLIGVTSFFRDPEAYDALRHQVIDDLVATAEPGSTLRVWVAGCASGEEAYSLAIEFFEAMKVRDRRVALQIFATDLDREAVAAGRAGLYTSAIEEHVSEAHLETYFKSLDGRGYKVRSAVRDVVSFAAHDLTRDPPFSRMDLVTCRNVMIYLRSETQKRVLETLHFSLRPRGHLFLGTSESVNAQRGLFSTVSKRWRIYRKVGASRPLTITGSSSNRTAAADDALLDKGARTEETTNDGHDLARKAILAACVAPSVVVTQDDTVVFMHGDLRPYLQFPEGEDLRFNLPQLLVPPLMTRTRALLYNCRRDRTAASAVCHPDGKLEGRVRIRVAPARGVGDNAVVITFEPMEDETSASESNAPSAAGDDSMFAEIERELQATREDLRSTVEELETSNEELRSSNEESMTMNEELQSANEELEATTEELRSLNEELTTVNIQLRDKVEQIERSHDDLQNFFASTKIATLFLDVNLDIVRFTPAAAELLGLDQADIGQSVNRVTNELLQRDLVKDARTVLEHLGGRARELHTTDDRWITRRVLPYRTESRRIEGVVITFADITELKQTTTRLSSRERQQAVIAKLGIHALREGDVQVFFDQAVRMVQQTLDTDLCEVLELQPGGNSLLLRAGVGWRDGLAGNASVSAGLDSQTGFALQSPDPVIVSDLATERRFAGSQLLVDHEATSGVSCVIRGDTQVYGVVGVHTVAKRKFSAEDANFLQAVARILGSAVGRYQTAVRLAAERAVSRVLAETSNVEETFDRVLAVLAREIQGDLAELWWPDDEERLRCRRMHTTLAGDKASIRERFSGRTFRFGDGLVGRTFEDARAIWGTDLGDPVFFPRSAAAQELGLVSCIAFPVIANNKTKGVITVFSAQRLIADDMLARSLEGIGRTVGGHLAWVEAQEEARRLAAITQSSHDAVLACDFEGYIIEWLGGAELLYGYSANEIIGTNIFRLVPEEHHAELRAIYDRCRQNEVVEPVETQRCRSDGTVVDVSVRHSLLRSPTGEVIGVASTERDVTRQKETERQLVAAAHQKDEFLAMLGHELRNPLAAIRNAAELIRLRGGDDATLQRLRAILERQTAHMAKLLDGLLDVSRIIRGKIRLETSEVDFVDVCEQVVADIRDRIQARPLEIEVELAEGPLIVEADRVRLVQIVDNLMTNATKYTPDGGRVNLTLRREDGSAVLEVRDTGIGIEADLLPQVFDVFRQAEQSLDRSSGGLGLGLALVKSLVELLGGDVRAMSNGKDQGATFTVRLPLVRAPTPVKRRRTPAVSDQLHVLLIEDNVDSAEMLSAVLEVAGHQVTVAHRGREGVEKAKALTPDVILCDVGLPDGMTGYDVARALRADDDTRDIHLVAVTGYGRPEDEDRCREAGFDRHMTKPVDLDAIRALLSELPRD